MEILCGVPSTADAFLKTACKTDTPILVSANAFWDDKRKKFRGHQKIWESEVPVALDCGGFVAMKRYGGYRWTVADYVEMATELRPVWWAAMDCCCEPEIASNNDEVQKRIRATVFYLAETLASVYAWNHHLPGYQATNPMPVIQGWKPEDYKRCIQLIEDHILCDDLCQGLNITGWPNLVGVGSVCRRNTKGPNGILKIIETLDASLPRNVQFHLFGVKSQAAQILKDHPRIASVDSMAWNMAGRWEAFKTGQPKTQERLAQHMETWVTRQKDRTKPSDQLSLL